MPQAILSTLEYDGTAPVQLALLPAAETGNVQRRANRVATLDGGAVFNDFGFSQADRTFELRWSPTSAAQEADIARLVRSYPKLTCALAEGLFLAAPLAYTPGDRESRLTLLVDRRLDA